MKPEVWALAGKLSIVLLAFFAPAAAMVAAVGVLVIADLVTGIWASIKEGQKITSYGLRRTIAKVFLFEVAVLLAFIVEKVFIQILPVTQIVAGLIALTELTSALENIGRITGLNVKSIVERLRGSNSDKP